MPQGIPSFSTGRTAYFLYGNVNAILRSLMPGLCCSLVLDAKKGKTFSVSTLLLLLSFFYFCFNVYFMATGFVGIMTVVGWFVFRKILKTNYKTAYLLVIAAVAFVEIMVVFLFGDSEYGAFISDLFMKKGFSGREALWSNILYFIPQKIMMGFGFLTKESLETFVGNKFGCHNYYLDLVFQRGLLGTLPLLLLFVTSLFVKKKKINESTCVLLGFCSSYLAMFLMEPFLGTEMLHLPIFCITMSLLLKNDETKSTITQ